jgi:hypothetical protein
MTVARITICVALAALASGCGGNRACEKPEPYQASVEGRRITAPEGLDELSAAAELKVPEASPQDPQPQGAPCLELPPSYRTPAK